MSTEENRFIVWVDDLDDNAISIAGSKMARLGELRKMGIKVPDGFVVTTNAFNAFMKANNLGMQIAKKIKLVTDADDFDQIEIVSKEIRNLFEVSEIPGYFFFLQS